MSHLLAAHRMELNALAEDLNAEAMKHRMAQHAGRPAGQDPAVLHAGMKRLIHEGVRRGTKGRKEG